MDLKRLRSRNKRISAARDLYSQNVARSQAERDAKLSSPTKALADRLIAEHLANFQAEVESDPEFQEWSFDQAMLDDGSGRGS